MTVPRPSPLSMRPRPVVRKDFADVNGLPRRGLPDEIGILDTGTLYSLSADPGLRRRVLDHYAGRLQVSTVVHGEVLRRHETPANRRQAHLMPVYLRADATVRWMTNEGLTAVATADDGREFDRIREQLQQLAAARARPGDPEPVEAAGMHAGEADSLVLAVDLREQGHRPVLLTADGGASLVAESMNVPARHVGHVMRELACSVPDATTAGTAVLFDRVTAGVGTPPAGVLPTGDGWFVCLAVAGDCPACDALTP